ncbi:hypothetical protein Cni_G18003 [Canna indica]|uniref:60S ribosomal protein L35 n=1 Tax=Canna indica TaxID=4628 RepID=A0AAQ3KIF5_9LILI|nr:hypothetical protein Cni_G18003 [Canna indica]
MAKSIEEDYIDMDFSCSTSVCSSPPHDPTEFEFHLSSNPPDLSQALPSPADELFYKGKLLPLHLPPRLQMVEQLLCEPPTSCRAAAASTPYDSCNASPAPSRRASGELSAEDYFHDCLQELAGSHPKKTPSWARKLKEATTHGLKLKAPRAYLKSFFAAKSGGPKAKKRAEKTTTEAASGEQRRSFSGGAKYTSQAAAAASTKSSISSSFASSKSSSFSSVNSSELNGQLMLKRNSSVNSDAESSIQGAIAYCKKSQLQVEMESSARKSAGFCLLSVTKIAPDCEHEKNDDDEIALRIKVHELRGKTKAELQNQLKDLKNELSLLRIAKVTGGAPNKLSKIKVVRLSIARVLTIISQKQKAALREAYKNKKLLPLDLRPKKTRAIRRKLTKHQESLKTERERKREMYFPMRKYAIKA